MRLKDIDNETVTKMATLIDVPEEKLQALFELLRIIDKD